MSIINLVKSFDTQDWIYIISSILSFIPLYYSIKINKRTLIREYKVIMYFWLLQTISTLFTPFFRQSGSILSWQLRFSATNWLLFLLFLHTYLIVEAKKRKFLILFRYFIVVYAFILQIIILFWTSMEQTSAKQFFWHSRSNPYFPDEGAGLVINNLIIYSTNYTIVQDLYSFIIVSFFLLVYFTRSPAHKTPRIRRGFLLWRITVASFFLYMLIANWSWRFMEINPLISFVCAITGLVLIALITIFYPEAYLISHTQLIKVRNLYSLIEGTSEETQQMDDNDVLNYIRSIPSDFK